jgi:hypothetical protein
MNDTAVPLPASTASAACKRRRRFASESAAWTAIGNLRTRGQDCERVTVVHCTHCRGWHLAAAPSILGAAIQRFHFRMRA